MNEESLSTQALFRFYVVAGGAIYIVQDELESRGPSIQRMNVSVVEDDLQATPLGSILNVTRHGLALYPPPERESTTEQQRFKSAWNPALPEQPPSTPPIVAMFLSKDEALRCLESTDHLLDDPRWRKETDNVLNALEYGHPAFYVPKNPQLNFHRHKDFSPTPLVAA